MRRCRNEIRPVVLSVGTGAQYLMGKVVQAREALKAGRRLGGSGNTKAVSAA